MGFTSEGAKHCYRNCVIPEIGWLSNYEPSPWPADEESVGSIDKKRDYFLMEGRQDERRTGHFGGCMNEFDRCRLMLAHLVSDTRWGRFILHPWRLAYFSTLGYANGNPVQMGNPPAPKMALLDTLNCFPARVTRLQCDQSRSCRVSGVQTPSNQHGPASHFMLSRFTPQPGQAFPKNR